MKARTTVAAALLVAFFASSRPASAGDATAFLGARITPDTSSARGAALGFGFLIVAFEVEYSASSEHAASGIPSLKVGSFNGLLQTPVPIAGFQFYATAGGGVFHEALQDATTTNVAVNIGGGVKVTLAGPLRLRIDYRVFQLSGSPINSRVQRLYAGVNLKF